MKEIFKKFHEERQKSTGEVNDMSSAFAKRNIYLTSTLYKKIMITFFIWILSKLFNFFFNNLEKLTGYDFDVK